MHVLTFLMGLFFTQAGFQQKESVKVLTPAEAASHEGDGMKVTVEFEVRSCHPVLPDGKHFRLCSEESFKDKKAFVVHLMPKALADLATDDLEEHYLGRKIQVSGEVEKTVFSSIAETRPGISVDEPSRIRIVKEEH